MEIELTIVIPEEAPLLYTQTEHDEALGCIGHLRGDFGPRGNEFWSTWWEHQSELKTMEFVEEFDTLVNRLRDDGILSSRTRMADFCGMHPEARIAGAWWHPDIYGFRTETSQYKFFIRCFPHAGDYNFYIYCYKKNERQQNGHECGEIPPPPAQKKKKNLPER